MPQCSNRDIAAARRLAEEIKRILAAHERGKRNRATLQDVKVLCICIIHMIRDPYCQQRICEVAIHSDAMDKPSRWGRGSDQLSTMLLKRLILKSLDAFDDRLKSLERTPRSGHGTSGRSAAARVSFSATGRRFAGRPGRTPT